MCIKKAELFSNDLIKAVIQTIFEPIRTKKINNINIAMNQLQQESENLVNTQIESVNVDCKLYCTFCCHNQVSLTAPEVMLISDYIKNNFTKDEILSLKKRVDSLDKDVKGMNAFQRKKAKKACALLIDNKCSVYPVRPLACKGWNSMSVKDCEDAFNSGEEKNIQAFAPPLVITNSVSIGISNSLKNNGMNSDNLELNSALKIVLEKYNVSEKYLEGKNIFREAKHIK
ncbi:MAG: YkgJ family cysteine cluster protein [Candidatus Sericytochromatia bacterium]